jgi:hypothetical protein
MQPYRWHGARTVEHARHEAAAHGNVAVKSIAILAQGVCHSEINRATFRRFVSPRKLAAARTLALHCNMPNKWMSYNFVLNMATSHL